MKMMKKMIRKILAFTTLAFAFLAISCSNIGDKDEEAKALISDSHSSSALTYISVNVENADAASSRTLLPSIEISDLVLKGARESGEEQELAAADTLAQMSAKQIEIQTGNWSFTLTATVAGVAYSGTLTKEIKSTTTESEKTLNFTLEPADGTTTGTLEFSLSFTGTAGVDYEVTIKFDNDDSTKQTSTVPYKSGQTIKWPDSEHGFTNLDFTAEDSNKTHITHTIEVNFYAKNIDSNNSTDTKELNTYQSIFRIERGVTTKAEVTNFNLNDVYSITYDGYEPETKEGVPVADTLDPANTVVTLKFNRKSGEIESSDSTGEKYITLPKLSNSTMTFSGWYTKNPAASDFTETSKVAEFGTAPDTVQKIKVTENLSDITLYAKWMAETTGNIYTPMDYEFGFTAKGLRSEKGSENTVTITPTVTRKESNGTTTDIDYSDISDDVTLSASLWNDGIKVSDITATTSGKAYKVTVPALDFEEKYTLKVTAEYLGINHDASFTLKCEKTPAGFVLVPAGSFDGTTAISGSSVFISGRTLEIPSLIACDHEVTQGEYEQYCNYNSNQPTEAKGKGPDYPAYYITWYNAVLYCNLRTLNDSTFGNTTAERLSHCAYAMDGDKNPDNWSNITKTNGKYCAPASSNSDWNGITFDLTADGWRLPTEAEWEYLARAGNTENYGYSGSNDINEVAWYGGNSSINGGATTTHEVKGKKPNGLGLYDMSGNVWEWCWDWKGTITSSTGYTGVSSGEKRALGGGCHYSPANRNIVNHGEEDPHATNEGLGFRLVRTAE